MARQELAIQGIYVRNGHDKDRERLRRVGPNQSLHMRCSGSSTGRSQRVSMPRFRGSSKTANEIDVSSNIVLPCCNFDSVRRAGNRRRLSSGRKIKLRASGRQTR